MLFLLPIFAYLLAIITTDYSQGMNPFELERLQMTSYFSFIIILVLAPVIVIITQFIKTKKHLYLLNTTLTIAAIFLGIKISQQTNF